MRTNPNFENLIRAFGAVGSASERHSEGHKFESCNAHHKRQNNQIILSLKYFNLYSNFGLVIFYSYYIKSSFSIFVVVI